MKAFALNLPALSVSAAFTWPAFWVTLALNITVTFVSILGAEPTWWQRLLAVLAAQVAMFAVVGLGASVERRVVNARWHSVAAIAWFALSGLARGGTIAALFSVWGVASASGEWARLLSGVTLAWAVLIPMSLFTSSARFLADVSGELERRRLQLASAAQQSSAEIRDSDRMAVERVKGQLAEALVADAGVTASAADHLEHVASRVVRPLSHDLAAVVPEIAITDPGEVPRRMRWRRIIDIAASGRPLHPVATGAVIAMLSVVSFGQVFGLVRTLVFFAATLIALVVVMELANRGLQSLLPRFSLEPRVVLTLLLTIGAGVVTGLAASLIARLVDADVTGTQLRLLVIALALVVPLLGLPITVAWAAQAQLRETVLALEELDERLERLVARLGILQWTQQRSLARALHGPVQTAIAAGVARLRLAGASNEEAEIERVRDELFDALDIGGASTRHVTWEVGIQRVVATWAGLCSLDVCVDPDALQVMEADRPTGDIALEIVTEAVSNAVRHGGASMVTVKVWVSDPDLCVSVANDGQSGVDRVDGLGTRILRDCAVRWSRGETSMGVRLDVALPLSTN